MTKVQTRHVRDVIIYLIRVDGNPRPIDRGQKRAAIRRADLRAA